MHCFTCTVVVKFVCLVVIFEIIFIELSEQVLTHRCKLGKEKMFDNCSIDYSDMSMWCDGSIFTGIPDPRTAKIKTIAPPTYAKVMYLNNSCVETINPAILSQYRYLRKLYLDDNCIGNLGRQTFNRCIRLVKIVLSRNKLTTIDNDAFAGLEVLDTLILSKNSLRKITEDVFALLSNLRVLDLSDNSINYIREQAFFKLQRLQELNLSGNRLNVISQTHFSNLKNLRILSLRGNHITTIHAFAFFGSQLLQTIDLGYNNMHCLSQKIFMDNNELASIKLNNNSLRLPRSEWFRELHKPKERPTTFSASLSGNPWSCNCDSYDYWIFLNNLNDEEWEETFDFRCSFPANRKGEKIFSLPLSTMTYCIYGNNEEGLCPGETDQAPPPSIPTKTSKPLMTTTIGQCPMRIYAKAKLVKRPCLKPCTPQGNRCRRRTICLCDHECGYSCINPNRACSPPPNITNMARWRVYRSINSSLIEQLLQPYKYDDVAQYECLPGYRLEQPLQTHLCHGRKRWTGSPMCALSCRPFNQLYVSRNNLVCGPECVTNDDCDGVFHCMCDGHCGRTCVDPDVRCSPPSVSNNSRIEFSGQGFQRRAHYTCFPGFVIQSGDSTRKCSGGGTWDGQPVQCERIRCTDPMQAIQAMGGEIVNRQPGPYFIGRELTFRCGHQRRLLGSQNKTCMGDGQWSGVDTICDYIGNEFDCPHPGVPINGNLHNQNFSVGSVIEFDCDVGYSMIGESQQECLYFLQWSGDGAPKCVGQCPMRIYAKAKLVKRPCLKPCTPQGNRCRRRTICLCDHECGYSCINPNRACSPPPNITNMARWRVYRSINSSLIEQLLQPYKYDDVAQYECLPGYRLEQPLQTHLCHGRKRWTGSPMCALSCRPFNQLYVSRNNLVCGPECVTNDDCDGVFHCMCDGHCGRTCVDPDVRCSPPSVSNNSRIEFSGQGFQRRAHYTCFPGFVIQSGDSTRKCSGGGTWDGQPVQCERIRCTDPMQAIQAMGGEIVNRQPGPYFIGRELTFRCGHQRRLLGSQNKTCMGDGQWSGVDTICDYIGNEFDCPHPGVPINGNLHNQNFSVGSVIEFDCDVGYSMIGESQQECLYFLQWSGDGAPKCVDPRYPESNQEALHNLIQTAENIEEKIGTPNIGHALDSNIAPDHEIYFVMDISQEVTDDDLNKSLKYAQIIALKLSRNEMIRCAVIAFASSADTMLSLKSARSLEIVNILKNILKDRQNLHQKLGELRNTTAGLQKLAVTMHESNITDTNIQRSIFLYINGKQDNNGNPPQNMINTIKREYEENLPQIYVISYGSALRDYRALDEVKSLAFPIYLFLKNPTISQLNSTKTENRVKRCPAPVAPVNGEVNDRGLPYVYREEVRYNCVVGYTLEGNAVGRCNENGTWGAVPMCTIKRCPAPVSPVNGEVNDRGLSYVYHEEVRYNCYTGYTLEGNEVGRCNENGTWGPVPICTIHLNCDFESFQTPLCGYSNDGDGLWRKHFVNEDGLWRRHFVNEDEYGGYVGSLVSSSSGGILRSPTFSTRNSAKCLQFYYKLQAFNDQGSSFTVQISESPPVRLLYPGEKRFTWLNFEKTIDRSNTDVVVSISANAATIYIDNIDILEEPCDDDCNPTPCRNDATCISRINSYKCICPVGFDGKHCETKITCAYPKLQDGLVAEPARTPDGRISVNQELTFSCSSPRQELIGSTRLTCLNSGRLNSNLPFCKITTDCDFEIGGNRTLCKYTNTGRRSHWSRKTQYNYRLNDYIYFARAIVRNRLYPAILQSPLFTPRHRTHCLQFDYYYDFSHRKAAELEVMIGENRYKMSNTGTNTWHKMEINIDRSFEEIRLKYFLLLGRASLDNIKVLNTACDVSCPPLSLSDNVVYASDQPQSLPVRYGQQLEFECNPSWYELQGNRFIHCQNNGMWSTNPPTCQDFNKCGQAQDVGFSLGRTTHGEKANDRAWPWQAVLFPNDGKGIVESIKNLKGGGSLINKYWVMTAAHVMKAFEYDRCNVLEDVLIALGLFRRPTRDFPLVSSVTFYRPKHVLIHPLYNNDIYDYDIALIRIGKKVKLRNGEFHDDNSNDALHGEVKLSPYIRPVCLPCTGTCVPTSALKAENGDDLLSGNESPEEKCRIEGEWILDRERDSNHSKAVITGFGNIGNWTKWMSPNHKNPKIPKDLQQGLVRILPNNTCEDRIGLINNKVEEIVEHVVFTYTPRMFCVESGEDDRYTSSCGGDSGGPLVKEIVNRTSGETCWVQIGIVSWGYGCGAHEHGIEYPGYYTDISSVYLWIKNALEGEDGTQ